MTSSGGESSVVEGGEGNQLAAAGLYALGAVYWFVLLLSPPGWQVRTRTIKGGGEGGGGVGAPPHTPLRQTYQINQLSCLFFFITTQYFFSYETESSRKSSHGESESRRVRTASLSHGESARHIRTASLSHG